MSANDQDQTSIPQSKTRCFKVENSNVTVGKYTYVSSMFEILSHTEGVSLDIGSFCSIAAKVSIFLGGNHRTHWMSTYPFGAFFTAQLGGANVEWQATSNGNVVVGNDVWIGYNSMIMSGITIGDGAVIAANSHVVKNVEPYEIVGGNPARHIKFRFEKDIRDMLLHLKWWDLSDNDIKSISHILSSEPSAGILTTLIKRFRE